MHTDINTRLINMPTSIRSYVIAGLDEYTIVLNSNMSYQMNVLAYAHELNHIKNGDYEKKGDINFIEINAHRLDN